MLRKDNPYSPGAGRKPVAMNEIVRKRKSIRKYDPAKLDASTLEKTREQIESIIALYPDIRYSIEIADKASGLVNVKAPHYLRFGSEEREGAFENIGFIGQQMDLYFSDSGLGSCWLGMGKVEGKDESSLPYVISMAFGKPAEPLHRDITGFNRKALADISAGADVRLEAARLAPSARNKQGWYFIAEGGNIHCFREKQGGLLGSVMDKLGAIDIGIALYHIASETDGFRFASEGSPDMPGALGSGDAPKGFIYIGTVLGAEAA